MQSKISIFDRCTRQIEHEFNDFVKCLSAFDITPVPELLITEMGVLLNHRK